jgi:lysozyme
MGARRLIAIPLVRRLACTMAMSAAGLTGLTHQEGEVLHVYPDVVHINTVCVGHVTSLPVGTVVTHDYCQELLKQDTRVAAADVGQLVHIPVTQEQFDALASFDFNLGRHALATSTLLRKANAGDCVGAGAEFARWNKAGGKPVKGLTNRRAWEASLWMSGC